MAKYDDLVDGLMVALEGLPLNEILTHKKGKNSTPFVSYDSLILLFAKATDNTLNNEKKELLNDVHNCGFQESRP